MGSFRGDRDNYGAAFQILEMDGIRGFLYIAPHIGKLALTAHAYVIDDHCYELTKNEAEEAALNFSLRQSDDPGIAAYMIGVAEL